MFKVLILFSLLGFFSVDALSGNNLVIKITKVETINNENPYFGETTIKMNEENNMDMDFSIYEPIPDETMVHFHLERDNGKPKDFKIRFCDATQEIMIGRNLFGSMVPSLSCPTPTGAYYVKNYKPDQTFLPPTLSDGPFTVTVTYGSPSGDVYLVIKMEGEISHTNPIPSLGI